MSTGYTGAGQEKTWLEVALNGPWGKRRHPELPVSEAEIIADGIACVQAGAAILHLHAYDRDSGRQSDDWQIYARIIEGIRDKVDAIIYPTIPVVGAAKKTGDGDAVDRYRQFDELAKRGLLEWSAIDPGSVNLSPLDYLAEQKSGFLYKNHDDNIHYAMDLAAKYGLHTSYAIYEAGFARAGAAFAQAHAKAPTPIYRLMFTEGYSFGFPAKPYALEAYLALLQDINISAPWMIAGLLVSIEPLIEQTIAASGHIRVGLEDAPRDDERNNLAWVKSAVEQIAAAGGEIAGVEDVRSTFSK